MLVNPGTATKNNTIIKPTGFKMMKKVDISGC